MAAAQSGTETWRRRNMLAYKGVYLPAPSPTESNVVNLTLLKAALAFLQYQIKLRTEFVSENGSEKWFRRSRAIKNGFEALSFVGGYNLPYSDLSIKEISVRAGLTPIGTNTGRRLGRSQCLSGIQSHSHGPAVLQSVPAG